MLKTLSFSEQIAKIGPAHPEIGLSVLQARSLKKEKRNYHKQNIQQLPCVSVDNNVVNIWKTVCPSLMLFEGRFQSEPIPLDNKPFRLPNGLNQ